MFKKYAGIAATAAVVSLVTVWAGFDMYTSKNYTTLMKPTTVGVTQTAIAGVLETNNSVASSSVDGVDCIGLIGRGAVVLSLNPGVSGTLSAVLSASTTTNGTYITVTNDQGEAAWAVTNTAAFKVIPMRPNAFSRYWRTTITATGCTNGSAGAILVTE